MIYTELRNMYNTFRVNNLCRLDSPATDYRIYQNYSLCIEQNALFLNRTVLYILWQANLMPVVSWRGTVPTHPLIVVR